MAAEPPRIDSSPTWNFGIRWGVGFTLYALAVWGLWNAAHVFGVARSLQGRLAGPFSAVAAMLAVFWAFGWGAGEPLARWLADPPVPDAHRQMRRLSGRSVVRILSPGLFCAAIYLLTALPLQAFTAEHLLAFFALSSALAGLLEYRPPAEKFSWQDGVVLAGLALPVEYGWLQSMLPQPGLGNVVKFLLADVGLYLYVVQRRLPGIGFDLKLRLHDLAVGARHWAFFAPLGVGLGLALGFIQFHLRLPAPGPLAASILVTFIFVALPEEIFFRGLLQNLLETRMSRRRALALAAAIFGLSHYVHGPVFNWRYVILAAIAGWFYGRAWRAEKRLGASAVSHTLVDVVWITWLLRP